MQRYQRKLQADWRWLNWFINRRRLNLNPTRKELRALSHRRVF